MPPFPLNLIGDLFDIFFRLTVNLLVAIMSLVNLIHLPGVLGLAIVILTILIRLLLWPFTSSQMKLAKKTAELRPHIDALKEKHKDDRQAFAAAQAALYKEHGINPAAGCLPAIVQIPIVWALYQAIQGMLTPNGLANINNKLFVSAWHLKAVPDHFFLGFDLASRAADFPRLGLFVLIVPLLTAFLQYIQSSMMVTPPVKPYPSDSPKEKEEKKEAEDAAAAMQSQMRFMLPLMVGYFAFTLPTALPLYWNTLSLVSIYQQYRISGWGSLQKWVDRIGRK